MGLESIVLMNKVVNSKIYRWIVVIAAIISFCVAGFGAYDLVQRKELTAIIEKVSRPDAWDSPLSVQVMELKSEIKDIRESINKGVPEGTQRYIETDLIHKKINELSQRMLKIEASLLDSPEKALAVPLLRKEIESLEGIIAISRFEIERIYTILWWLIPLMVTIALSSVGIVYSNRNQKSL